MIFIRNINFIWFCPLVILLSACTLPGMSPIAQIDHLQHQFASPASAENRQVVKEKAGVEYVCQDQKGVRLQQINKKTINVTFGQTTHKLSSTVTKTHKKYSNIRWIWTEDFNGKGTLKNNRNNILAEGCVRK